MLQALSKKYPFNNDLKVNLQSFAGVSLGVFLFLLFFQPLNLRNPDFENRLLIIAGFGAISLLWLCIIRILFPSFFSKRVIEEGWNYARELIINLAFLAFNSVAFVFYARYVGQIPVTFHTVVIIVIISIAEMVIIVIINELFRLKKIVRQLNELVGIELIAPSEAVKDVEIEFSSSNKSDYFKIFLEQILLIKSANNYIEVIYKTDDKISRKLIRNTINNTEELFAKYPTLVRCHRSCIVNRNSIQKIVKANDGLKLVLFDYPQEIPVSRQYALKLKEAIKQAG